MAKAFATWFGFVLLLGACPSGHAASPEFTRRYETALQVVTETDPTSIRPKGTDYILTEFTKVREAGSLQDIADAVALTLRDKEKRSHWMAAATFASMLGPDFDRSGIVAAVRDNFTSFFVIDPVKGVAGQEIGLPQTMASLLCYYGTEADVQRLQRYINDAAKVDTGFANSLQVSVATRPHALKQRGAAPGDPVVRPVDPGPGTGPALVPPKSASKSTAQNGSADEASPSSQPTSSSWPIIAVMAVAALGLLWLLLRRRGQ